MPLNIATLVTPETYSSHLPRSCPPPLPSIKNRSNPSSHTQRKIMSIDWNTCSAEKKACVGWIEKYFKDCVCNLKGEISFTLGIVSLFCWGIAEIPQIITNFKTKSGHGVSLAFLFTWVIGDIFNLVGCLLEPVTLPTQFYTALLYTIATVILVVQTIYYDYFTRWWKNRSHHQDELQVEEGKETLNPKLEDQAKPISTISDDTSTITSSRASPRIDMYYTSARSLASSGTPPFGRSSYTYLGPARSGPAASLLHDTSDDDDDEDHLDSATTWRRSSSRPSRIASLSAGYGTLIAGSTGLPYQGKALRDRQMVLSGKRILEETRIRSSNTNSFGVLLGWIMAAIYMGGRLPQIYLNIKRGSVEGLNPLMFLFALIANATYVGSILVRSTGWERIKANLPWLLDAIVCVLLDLFIILQYCYYKFMHGRTTRHNNDFEVYDEEKKLLA